jgi:hypothetical protein
MAKNKIVRYFSSPLLGAIALGVMGFLSGFLGPMILNPGANQGPMLGIFMTGPGGFVLGLVIGYVCAEKDMGWRTQVKIFCVVGIVGSGLILFFCLIAASDINRGVILDGEIQSCQSSEKLAAAKVAYWRDYFQRVDYLDPREGWEKDLDRMVAADQGVVIELLIHRQWALYENTKPWNRGDIRSRSSNRDTKKTLTYYSRINGSSCSDYPVGKRQLFHPRWEPAKTNPPDTLPAFLKLPVLLDTPSEYLKIIGE